MSAKRILRAESNQIGISCLPVFVAMATAAYAEDVAPAISAVTFHDYPARGGT